MINVTKVFLPPKEEYLKYVDGIWDRAWITNNGPLVLELEQKIKAFLRMDNFWYTSNGTVPLQMAIKALEISNAEIITTPFSYVATTNAILWENNKPVFVDINKHDYTIDAGLIEAKITSNTKAILATHVYGNPCDVEAIGKIAQKYNLKVIYDGAHAFGVEYKGKSIFNHGDVSTVSFHATKVFHTTEGGGIFSPNNSIHESNYWLRQFGHRADEYKMIGINAKNSEFHAAMGLSILPHWNAIQEARKTITELYDQELNWNTIEKPIWNKYATKNYAYYPICVASEQMLHQVMKALFAKDILPRRYFYPSLNKLTFLQDKYACPVSESVASRVLSLPLYTDLPLEKVKEIATIINNTVN
jgi:dTDP-4-amino-4,6-dideoxygalactose transaminase